MSDKKELKKQNFGRYINDVSIKVILGLHTAVVSLVIYKSNGGDWKLPVAIYLIAAVASILISEALSTKRYEKWVVNLSINTGIGVIIDYSLALATLYSGKLAELLIYISQIPNKANNKSTQTFCDKEDYAGLSEMCKATGKAVDEADKLIDNIDKTIESAPIFGLSLWEFTLYFTLVFVILTVAISILRAKVKVRNES